MSQLDYYQVLNVTQEASPEQIKRAYRRLALDTHPDRNPNDARAEERFKQINEAYGVLSDPQKRAQYDRYRSYGYHQGTAGSSRPGFGYSQEEIFRDFFNSRQAQDIFSEMQREFQRNGFRFDERFVNRMFFGGKGNFVDGFFWMGKGPGIRIIRFGTGGRPGGYPGSAGDRGNAAAGREKPKGLLEAGISMLARAGKKIGGFILDKALGLGTSTGADEPKRGDRNGSDVTYKLVITPNEARSGAVVEVELPHLERGRRVSVSIPPGVRSGTKLRLREMGNPLANAVSHRGDLYIHLDVV